MRIRILVVLLMLSPASLITVTGNETGSQAEPQKVTLYAEARYKAQGYGRSAFNFQHGIRSDDKNWRKLTGNYYQLVFGNVAIDVQANSFGVAPLDESWDRIKDIGPVEWADLCCATPLPVRRRARGGIRAAGPGESIEASSDGRVTEAVAGHMYVVHIKTKQVDLYAMFRVEELENDHCTISWKVMPSPE